MCVCCAYQDEKERERERERDRARDACMNNEPLQKNSHCLQKKRGGGEGGFPREYRNEINREKERERERERERDPREIRCRDMEEKVR